MIEDGQHASLLLLSKAFVTLALFWLGDYSISEYLLRKFLQHPIIEQLISSNLIKRNPKTGTEANFDDILDWYK